MPRSGPWLSVEWTAGRGVVEQDVEDEVALVLVGADDPGVQRDVVGHQRVADHTLAQAEVLRGVAGVDGRDRGLELLAVAAGGHRIKDIEVTEDRESRNRVGQAVVGFLEGFQPNEIGRGDRKFLIAQIADVSHAPESDVGGIGHQAGDDGGLRQRRLAVAPEHVLERLHEAGAPVDEQQQHVDIVVEAAESRTIVAGAAST